MHLSQRRNCSILKSYLKLSKTSFSGVRIQGPSKRNSSDLLYPVSSVKEVKLMALMGIRLHQYLDDWLIRAQSQEEAQVNTQDSGRSDRVHNKSREIRTETYSSVFVRGLRIPSRFSPCNTHSRWLKLPDLIL